MTKEEDDVSRVVFISQGGNVITINAETSYSSSILSSGDDLWFSFIIPTSRTFKPDSRANRLCTENKFKYTFNGRFMILTTPV